MRNAGCSMNVQLSETGILKRFKEYGKKLFILFFVRIRPTLNTRRRQTRRKSSTRASRTRRITSRARATTATRSKWPMASRTAATTTTTSKTNTSKRKESTSTLQRESSVTSKREIDSWERDPNSCVNNYCRLVRTKMHLLGISIIIRYVIIMYLFAKLN